MLPASLTLVDPDAGPREGLASHLRRLGVRVRSVADANLLLADADPFGDDFYIVELVLPGVGGEEFIRILRLRSDAGVLALAGTADGGAFEAALGAGADMHLARPASPQQITLAVQAVWRRIARQRDPTPRAWLLDADRRRLTTPEGAVIALGDNDIAILSCFPPANGAVVTRQALCQRLGRPLPDPSDNGLHAIIYRLRRRIGRVTAAVVPLQSQARVGYVFKAPIKFSGGH